MCGIVGLFTKSPALERQLGEHVAAMLVELSERGPDSAGLAVYRRRRPRGFTKLVLFHPDEGFDWKSLPTSWAASWAAGDARDPRQSRVLTRQVDADPQLARPSRPAPDVRRQAIEIFKEKGLPADVVRRFEIAGIAGSHAIGHTRMATESAVTTEHATPSRPAWISASSTTARSATTTACASGCAARASSSRPTMTARSPPATSPGAWARAPACTRPSRPASTISTASTPSASARRTASRCCATPSPASTPSWPNRRLGRDGHRIPRHRPPAGADKARIWEPAPDQVYSWTAPGDRPRPRAKRASAPSTPRLQSLRPDSNERAFRVADPEAPTPSRSAQLADRVLIAGHVGFYCGGMNQEARITVDGHAGPGVAENMMSGSVRVRGNC